MAKGIQRQLDATMRRVSDEINQMCREAGADKFQRGLATEGYAGGYLQALQDVDLALRGVFPNASRYWTHPSAPEGGKEKP